MSPDAAEAVAHVRARTSLVPRIGIVLGSGLGAVADAVADAVSIPYAELPGFPRGSVAGHARTLHLGTLAGVPVAVLQGRAHLYEGVEPAALVSSTASAPRPRRVRIGTRVAAGATPS